ncbi:MAG: 4'-phosphopantetheinyl transferase superfamily protein [Byssovorax sp.]
MAAEPMPLSPGEAHLFYVLEDQVKEPLLLARYEALLAPEERARRDRYRFDKNKHEYLLTRALCRTVLSRYMPVPPAAWTFSANAHGCPSVATPEAARFLRFNLTNTSGLVACLVARDRDVGVDVEDTERHGETVQIADRFFSPSEVAELKAQPPGRQRARFFDYWTLKEAYIKARGMGLAIPLDHFSYLLAEGRPIGIAFAPELPDDPASWQFAQHRPTPRHLISLAIRRRDEPDLRIVVRRVIPLLPAADVIEATL